MCYVLTHPACDICLVTPLSQACQQSCDKGVTSQLMKALGIQSKKQSESILYKVTSHNIILSTKHTLGTVLLVSVQNVPVTTTAWLQQHKTVESMVLV